MSDDELVDLLKDLVEAACSISDNVAILAQAMQRAVEVELGEDEE